MAELLTSSQVGELVKEATGAVRQNRLSFFDQVGLKTNFPWLTPDMARQQIQNRRIVDIDAGIALASMVFICADFLASQGLPNSQIPLVAGALGVTLASMLRGMGLPMPISKAYYNSVGGYEHYQQQIKENDKKAQQTEIDRLHLLIN